MVGQLWWSAIPETLFEGKQKSEICGKRSNKSQCPKLQQHSETLGDDVLLAQLDAATHSAP